MEGEPKLQLPLTREVARERLDDNGEHRFLMHRKRGPIFVIGDSVETLDKRTEKNRIHLELRESILKQKIVDGKPEDIIGGYCRVDGDELLYWGPSTYPVTAAEQKEFQKAVDERGIEIKDQWFGKGPLSEK